MARLLITKYHQELADFDVRIDYMFAFAELDKETSEKKGPAIKHNGWPALGLASRIKLKDRAKGMGDCEILLDADAWKVMPEAQRLALLDHELEHFEVKRDKFGGVVTDDLDRPVITIREHDRQHGWFDNIARRHGINSFEVEQFRDILIEAGGTYAPHILLAGSLEATENAPASKELQAVNDAMTALRNAMDQGELNLPTGRPRLVPKFEDVAPEVESVTIASNGGPGVTIPLEQFNQAVESLSKDRKE